MFTLTNSVIAFTKHAYFVNSSTSFSNTGFKTKCVIVTTKWHVQNYFDFTLYEFLAHYLVDPKAPFSTSKLKTLLARKSRFFLTDYVRYVNTNLVVFYFHLSMLELRQKRTSLAN